VPVGQWFAGQVALVTGASRGIGRAIAERLADEGASLVMTATSLDQLMEAADACRRRGVRVLAVAGDLGDPGFPAELVAAAEAGLGRLDVLVSNAFWDETAPVTEVTPAGWERTLRVTLTAPMLLAKAALPSMTAAGRGSIVLVSSMHGVSAGHGMPAYEAAKAGLFALTRSLAVDYGPRGVRSNCVAPGLVLSERVRGWYEGAQWRTRAMDTVVPLRRPGTPQEIASVVAFVASAEASYMNGSIVWVDGGSVAGLPENAALELAETAAANRPAATDDD
jgi:NAD(P)-dependent dehydrogenase (short-subunit alcohol dehydrogenase family)